MFLPVPTTIEGIQRKESHPLPGKVVRETQVNAVAHRDNSSAPRNIFLVKYLDNLRYFDGLGRGVPMMIKVMGDRIGFEEIGELFRVRLELIQAQG